jgi:hypothetical protein
MPQGLILNISPWTAGLWVVGGFEIDIQGSPFLCMG